MNQTVSFGDRLREERSRLGMSQTVFGEKAGVTKKSQMLYEAGDRFPDLQYLAELHQIGVDVLFVISGERNGDHPAFDAAELALVNSYRLCSSEARIHLIQTAALLSAGLGASTQAQRQSSNNLVGSQDQVHIGNNGIQVGSGRVKIKRGN